MKCLKEPLSRLANREEQTRGAFFEGRFKSVAILDEESLLATCAYIDLNPVAAGIAEVPEASAHTSIKQRVEHGPLGSDLVISQLITRSEPAKPFNPRDSRSGSADVSCRKTLEVGRAHVSRGSVVLSA
jgi:hypothetical protein